jgi:hypothetical protein
MEAGKRFERQAGDGFARQQEPILDPEQAIFYADALRRLNGSGIPYVLAGAFALQAYTGLWRNTKDLDIFLRPCDLEEALGLFRGGGYVTEIREDHWLAKATKEPYFVDLIFGMANGHVKFDEEFVRADQTVQIAGEPARLIGLEELIVSKVYIAVRDRFDGGDVVHLIRAAKGDLDWQGILGRMGNFRAILLWHLILFDFVYPGHSDYLPEDLITQLFEEVREEWSSAKAVNVCRGPILDQYSFAADILDWGYEDPRDLRSYRKRKGEAA